MTKRDQTPPQTGPFDLRSQHLAEWAGKFDPALLGLGPDEALLLNDDRAGRALDQLRLPSSAGGALPRWAGWSLWARTVWSHGLRSARPCR